MTKNQIRSGTPQSIKIAGPLTVEDWKRRRGDLTLGGDPTIWKAAFDDFFYQRLRKRYLDPIKALDAQNKRAGEGFAIMALHCSTIEFLGATLEGKNYLHDPSGKKADPATEYSKSGDMFAGFLKAARPFDKYFDGDKADQFYKHIRCPLLHEARTSGGWTIQVGGAGELIDADRKIVWRNRFPQAFQQFNSWYREELSTSKQYQAAFIRKFDGLCRD